MAQQVHPQITQILQNNLRNLWIKSRHDWLGWQRANVGVVGRPEWVFIKLYCHGFFEEDQPAMIGSEMQRFLEKTLEQAEQSGEFKITLCDGTRSVQYRNGGGRRIERQSATLPRLPA